MKDRIGIAVIALTGILISCFFGAGCVPAPGYITIDSQSEVMNPAFSMYLNQGFGHQERLDIGTIIVWEALHSSEETRGWRFNAGHVHLPMGYHPRPAEPSMVWYLQYEEPSDNFIQKLLGGSASPVSSLTYGDVPPDYQEKVKAGPLEPERFYIVQMREYRGRPSEGMAFIIRLNEGGIPERLEYHLKDFLITRRDRFTVPRDDLQLY